MGENIKGQKVENCDTMRKNNRPTGICLLFY